VAVEIPTYAAVCAARRRLGLGKQATLGEIKRAYHRAAARLHPDVNPSGEDTGARMAELVEAYRLLTACGKTQVTADGGAERPCAFDRKTIARLLLISLVRQQDAGVETPAVVSPRGAEAS
jgi:hypothetical protein